jgi:hypothetical protein
LMISWNTSFLLSDLQLTHMLQPRSLSTYHSYSHSPVDTIIPPINMVLVKQNLSLFTALTIRS